MLRQYKQYCDFRNGAIDTGVLDLSSCEWLSPTLLLPLAHFSSISPHVVITLPSKSTVANYFQVACTPPTAPIHSEQSYVPVVRLPADPAQADKFLAPMYATNNHGKDMGGQDAFKYFFGELIDNIYQHSECSCAKVMAQRYKRIGTAEMCLYDDGVTIHGSFKKKGLIFDADYMALAEAINGLSSKDAKERGFGISTNYALWTKGAKAEILIVSGDGAVYAHGTSQPNFYKLESPYRLQGTLISVRYKYPVNINIHRYTSGDG
jgi:hypothetical protein